MKPYKGPALIECRKKGGCLKKLDKDVEPGCMDCPEGQLSILDLKGKTIFKYRSPAEKTGTRVTRKKE